MILRAADIVFSNPIFGLADILKWALRNPWSHTAIATGRGFEVIGAEGEGVTKRVLSERELNDFAVLRETNLSPVEAERIVEWVEEKWKQKTKYSFKQLLIGFPFLVDVQEGDKVTCTNFVYLAYLSEGKHLCRRIRPALVDPSHLWPQSKLELVYYEHR